MMDGPELLSLCACYECIKSWERNDRGNQSSVQWRSEPEFLNFQGTYESTPIYQFCQPMQPGGLLRQPYSHSVTSPNTVDCLKIPSVLRHTGATREEVVCITRGPEPITSNLSFSNLGKFTKESVSVVKIEIRLMQIIGYSVAKPKGILNICLQILIFFAAYF